MQTSSLSALLSAICVLMAFIGCTPEYQYRVSRIIDGDTIEIKMPDGQQQIFDLPFIDAPERVQPMGREATLYLQNNLLNQLISFDEHNRIVFEEQPAALLLLQRGLAWQVSDNAPFDIQLAYQDAQQKAVKQGTGIWGLEHALRIPPWQWRQDGTRLSEYSKERARQNSGKDKVQQQKGL